MKGKLKILMKFGIYLMPAPIKKKLHAKIEERRLEEGKARYLRCKVSKDDVEKVLSQISFDHDVMLHSSMINIGRIAGGTKGVTDQILQHIDTRRHTLLVSALPYFGSFADYLHDG